jgi:hypothetical protein
MKNTDSISVGRTGLTSSFKLVLYYFMYFYKFMFLVFKYLFDKVKYVAVFIIIFSLFALLLNIWFPHEAFCMDPYDNITSDEDMISDEDVRSRLIISRKESYMSYSGINTYYTRQDIIGSLYPRGIPLYYNIVNDYYDGEKYFDIPLTMICESKNIELSDGIYSGCISRNIDGLLIWPEHSIFQAEFVKDYTQVIAKDSNIPSVSLGTRVIDRFVFVYIKCQDINKRKYHWTIWERTHISKYWSYKAFKKRWDSEASVWSNIDDNIRKDIIIEVKDLLGVKRLNGSVRKSVRSEVDKLIRKTKPFSTRSS